MGLLQRVVGLLFGLLFLAAMFVFASLVLAVLATVGLLVGGWMWWRTRALRASGRRETVVVEGQVVGRDGP